MILWKHNSLLQGYNAFLCLWINFVLPKIFIFVSTHFWTYSHFTPPKEQIIDCVNIHDSSILIFGTTASFDIIFQIVFSRVSENVMLLV